MTDIDEKQKFTVDISANDVLFDHKVTYGGFDEYSLKDIIVKKILEEILKDKEFLASIKAKIIENNSIVDSIKDAITSHVIENLFHSTRD